MKHVMEYQKRPHKPKQRSRPESPPLAGKPRHCCLGSISSVSDIQNDLCYSDAKVGFVALVIAILHFIMMRYLDGKPTDDSRYLAQQYVTSTSLLLVAAFKASLCSALATAFTQHMWKILRQEALRVSSIESLHGVRYNPFLLAKWRVFCATPLLYLIAMVMWLLAIAILFPPSALTIVQQRFEEQNSTLVPTYDAGSGQDIALTTIGSGHSLSLGTSSLSTWTEVSTNVNSESVTYMSYL
jgi:hypothetical protein